MPDKLILGCGYLGRRLVSEWLTRGDRVFATTRSQQRAETFRQSGIVPLLCDVTDPLTLKDLPLVESAIYCVGLDRAAGKKMREVYVTGLEHVLDHLPAPQRLLYVSSTSVYGQSGGEDVDETAPTEPLEESGQIVLQAEQALRRRFPAAVLLRFAGIYGPGRLFRAEALRTGEPLGGDPEAWLNLIHIEDGVSALLAAEERAQPGEVYNINDGHPVRRADFFAHLAQLLQAPPPHFSPLASDKARGQANRRVVNRRLHIGLGLSLRYPDYRVGLPACLVAP